ncbi:MAG: hypothetical protein J6Y85_01820 [Alphaproteobacteria bacterium]|nr:hypothetical protein [Alphaproteobacteria bacterium]
MTEHDKSGHCSATIHVDGYTRNGHSVASYERQCGRDHNNDKREANNVKASLEQNEATALPESHIQTSNVPMTTKYSDLILSYWSDLKQNEDFQKEGYLDTLGNITIGPGRKIDNEDDFIALPLEVNGRPATIAEKQSEWVRLSGFKKRGEYGKDYGFWKFQQKDESKKLKLPETAIVDMAMEHLEWDLGQLETKFPEFESYSRPLQTVLLDMQYNMGYNFNDKKWHYFHEGLNNKDISQMIEHVNRPQVAPDRNDWARRSLKEIPTVDGWHFKD